MEDQKEAKHYTATKYDTLTMVVDEEQELRWFYNYVACFMKSHNITRLEAREDSKGCIEFYRRYEEKVSYDEWRTNILTSVAKTLETA